MRLPALHRQFLLGGSLLLVLIVGYLTFRYFYGISDSWPFSQELILVFIGAIATVLITAMLLNQQTELELRKEGKVLLLDQKNSVYMGVIEKVADIVENRIWDERRIAELRVLNHKLAIIGSAEVIAGFHDVLRTLEAGLADGTLTDAQADSVMEAVARLTVSMREDIVGEIEGYDRASVLADVMANARGVERVDDLEPGARRAQ